MAGGEGTRLRPLTSNQPKPMVPIVNKPCMEHIIDLLKQHDLIRELDTAVDGLLAATAKVHGLTLVTRNVKHVHATGVAYLNPFVRSTRA